MESGNVLLNNLSFAMDEMILQTLGTVKIGPIILISVPVHTG